MGEPVSYQIEFLFSVTLLSQQTPVSQAEGAVQMTVVVCFPVKERIFSELLIWYAIPRVSGWSSVTGPG